MDPTDPLHPNAGEAAMSLEVALVVLAIGAVIFVYLIGKLVVEYRARRTQRDGQKTQRDGQKAQRDGQKAQRDGQKTQRDQQDAADEAAADDLQTEES